MAGSSQKFIARNRAPRVQIEYDVELYGAEKKIQLPFVMGVMSDLAGKSEEPQPVVADRKFLEIDVDNFDDRLKSMKPRAAFSVPNSLTGEGNMDGKTGAEELIAKVIQDPALLKTLAAEAAPKSDDDSGAE
jgi:type VI secretion system protein ImpB